MDRLLLMRRRRDSNPRYAFTYAGFQDRCIKPALPLLRGFDFSDCKCTLPFGKKKPFFEENANFLFF